MANNKKIKVELTIREDLDVDQFLEDLNDWIIEKDFINPIVPINEFPKKYREENGESKADKKEEMKVEDLKPGQIFTIDNTLIYPKLKLHKGFIDMRTQYIYSCKGNVSARLLSWDQIRKVMSDWGMSQEKFDKYKEELIKKYDISEATK